GRRVHFVPCRRDDGRRKRRADLHRVRPAVLPAASSRRHGCKGGVMATGMRIKNLQAVQRALEREVKKLRTPYYALVGIHESAKKPKGASMTMATLGAV